MDTIIETDAYAETNPTEEEWISAVRSNFHELKNKIKPKFFYLQRNVLWNGWTGNIGALYRCDFCRKKFSYNLNAAKLSGAVSCNECTVNLERDNISYSLGLESSGP